MPPGDEIGDKRVAADAPRAVEADTAHCYQLHHWTRASLLKLLVTVILATTVVLFGRKRRTLRAPPLIACQLGMFCMSIDIPATVTLGRSSFTQWLASFGAWSEEHRVAAAFGFAGIYMVAAVFLIPASLLTIVAGFVLGIPVGCIAVLVGATLGSALAFLNARFLFKEWVDRFLVDKYPKLKALSHVIHEHQLKTVVLLRLSPIVPFNALNYVLGIMPLNFSPYLAGSFFGMMPGTLLYIYIGTTAASIGDAVAGKTAQTPLQRVLFWGGLTLTVVFTLGISVRARRELRRHLSDFEEGGGPGGSEAGGGLVADGRSTDATVEQGGAAASMDTLSISRGTATGTAAAHDRGDTGSADVTDQHLVR